MVNTEEAKVILCDRDNNTYVTELADGSIEFSTQGLCMPFSCTFANTEELFAVLGKFEIAHYALLNTQKVNP